MDDVFAVDEPPPAGWVRALFEGGPFSDDIGRCVPGPPHPQRIVVQANGRRHTYHLTAVGSWSDPNDPIGIYHDGRWSVLRLRARQLYQREIQCRRLRWKFKWRRASAPPPPPAQGA